MQDLNSSSGSFRTRLDDAAFAACLSSIALALAVLAGSVSTGEPQAREPIAATSGEHPASETFTGTSAKSVPV